MSEKEIGIVFLFTVCGTWSGRWHCCPGANSMKLMLTGERLYRRSSPKYQTVIMLRARNPVFHWRKLKRQARCREASQLQMRGGTDHIAFFWMRYSGFLPRNSRNDPEVWKKRATYHFDSTDTLRIQCRRASISMSPTRNRLREGIQKARRRRTASERVTNRPRKLIYNQRKISTEEKCDRVVIMWWNHPDMVSVRVYAAVCWGNRKWSMRYDDEANTILMKKP